MFEHSIKVPRLYKAAAKIVKQCSETGASIKQLVYEAKHVNIKGIYALAAQAIKKKDELDCLLRKSKILEKETRFDPFLCRVLITELLWGKKKLPGEAKPVKTVLAYKQVLCAHCSDGSGEKEEEEESAKTVFKPKYVRVNTLKTTVEEIIDLFRNEGWTLVRHFEDRNYDNFLSKVANLGPEEFMLDLHIKELLVFPPKTEFHFYSFYKDGRIMIQDKASCLSAFLLNPEPGSVVLDMCAAPGMKTTQLAAQMQNEGKIYAFEINGKRFEALNKVVETAGATCVKTVNKDVLSLTTKDCQDVEYILVDPSCSGSGMVDRSDFNTKINVERLDKLARFQIKILKRALHRFPNAKRIVYSTCSLYSQENEAVVKEVLASSLKYKLVAADQYLPATWNSFGSPKFEDIGKFSLYSRPENDFTNGFFVAVIERLAESEENPFAVVDLEWKPKKTDVEIVGVVKVGTDQKNKKKKKNENKTEEKNGFVRSENGNKVEENHQNGVKSQKKRKNRSDSDCVEIGEVISLDDNSEQNEGKKNKDKSKKSKSNDELKTGEQNGENIRSNKGGETHQSDEKKQKKRKSRIDSDCVETDNYILIEDNSEQVGDKKKGKDKSKKNKCNVESKTGENKSSNEVEESLQNGVKKHKKKKNIDIETGDVISILDSTIESNENGVDSTKKKKKRKHVVENEATGISDVLLMEGNKFEQNKEVETIKKKKRRLSVAVNESVLEDSCVTESSFVENGSTKKKRKEKNNVQSDIISTEADSVDTIKKKKRRVSIAVNESILENSCVTENSFVENGSTKKKKREKNNVQSDVISTEADSNLNESIQKKKRKKRESNADESVFV